MNGDGLDDIVSFASTTRSIQIFTNQGDGTYLLTHENRAGGGQNSVLITELNNDGMPDLVSGSSQRGITVLDNLGDGTFPPYNGFANGTYYMGLNVPDTRDNDPDPVDTLEQLFADWRAGLEGSIDAIRTEVIAPSRVVRGSSYTVRVRARDWRGDALAPGAMDVNASVASGDGSVTDTRTPAPGIAEIDLTASASVGEDATIVRLDDGTGPVRLMPDVKVRVIESIADFDGSGQLNFFDIAEFVGAYTSQDPAADLNKDQMFDAADLNAFIALFLAP